MAKRLKLNIGDDGKLSVMSEEADDEFSEREEGERKVNFRGEVVSCEENKLRSVTENLFEDSDEFFGNFFEETTKLGLTGTVLTSQFSHK